MAATATLPALAGAAALPTDRPALSLERIADLVGARSMWNRGITGEGVAVAVIDTGVADVAGLRDRVVASVDLSVDQSDPAMAHVDQHGHGTHMAGIIAGRADDDSFRGIAPDARIVSVKVAGRDGGVEASALLAGIEWVIAHADDLGIRVINLAFSAVGADPALEQALHAAVERAWDAGIVVVTAAGNDGSDSAGLVAPATNPLVLSVGSLTVDDDAIVASDFTNRGDDRRHPDLAAPGAHVVSLRAPDSDADREHPEGYVDETRFLGSGSSQAAAVVAGVAALVIQHRPAITPDQVKQALVDAAAPVPGTIDRIGAGMVAAPAACFGPLTDATQPAARTLPVAVPAAPAAVRIALTPAGASWMGQTWTGASWMGASWMGQTWTGASWMGASWMGQTWTGASWMGASWMGNTWTGGSWMGASWMGQTWTGASWMGASWMGQTWTGASWMGASWMGQTWTGASWMGASWMGNTWTGASWM